MLGTGSATGAGTEFSKGSSIGRCGNSECDSDSTPAQVLSDRGSRHPRDSPLIVFSHSPHRLEETRSGGRQEAPAGSRAKDFLPDWQSNVVAEPVL